MTNLGIIAAFDDCGIIGDGDKIPWRISEDMNHFKNLTEGHPVIMGRKTYESIPERFRPLSGRMNIVLSRKSGLIIPGAYRVSSFNEALELIEEMPEENIDFKKSYVIGGSSVYEQALPFTTFMEITHVKGTFKGDVYFPGISWDDWKEISREDFQRYSFNSYLRK